ncbi:MAG: cation:proton antiporter, partial [Acidaminococcaceae bacterium]
MSTLPPIIFDLAIILLTAGVTMLLCKRFNQPLVLGYIIAGFLAGPNFMLFPTITDRTNINLWAEIGVIFLLFALGLEFSFNKLKSVGKTVIISAFLEISCMLCLGYACGYLLGWSPMNCLFLGGMVSMSSTTIIIKAFDDLGLKAQRFTQLVFGVLIVEDLVGIIMMVLLSTFAVASTISGWAMAGSILRLFFCLILWFVMGMYLVPSFFKLTKKYMNDETLLVVSIGLCLGMVILATHMGFSSALGAFIMGSLIAETPNIEKTTVLVKPVKDLFGAVFFVSVGMMVDPSLLWAYKVPILWIVLTVISGRLFFNSLGMFLAGQHLNTALRCGFSLAQIGEFSFIIASIGTDFNIIDEYLYPIIVAVSVITTFTTPFFIKMAVPSYQLLMKHLSPHLQERLARYTEDNNQSDDNDSDWTNYLHSYFTKLTIYLTLLIAISLLANYYLAPFLLRQLSPLPAKILAVAVTLLIMSPFLRMLLINRDNVSQQFIVLWFKKRTTHLPLLCLLFCNLALAAGFIFFVFSQIGELSILLAIVPTVLMMSYIVSSDWILEKYLKMEARFLINLNERHLEKHKEALIATGEHSPTKWLDESLFVCEYTLAPHSPCTNKTLQNLNFRKYYGFNILQITNGSVVIPIPGGAAVLSATAKLLILGTVAQIQIFDNAINAKGLQLCVTTPQVSLREYLLAPTDAATSHHGFLSCAIRI